MARYCVNAAMLSAFANAFALRAGSTEAQRHVHRSRIFVDFGLGSSLAQIVEDPFFPHSLEKRIGVTGLEWIARLQFPHFSDRGLALDVESIDRELTH